MLMLAVTGAIYLFNDEINDLMYPQQRFVSPAPQTVPLSRMVQGALAAVPGGSVTRIDTPRAHDRSAEVFVTTADGAPVRVYLDPGTGAALGTYVYTQTLVGIADVMHGSLMLGDIGDAIVELAACWGFVLTVTGLYLWWPRGRLGFASALLPRRTASGRRFWKSLHATIGFWCALLIMFLIITGLPWATVWGELFRTGTKSLGIGYPASVRLHGTIPSTKAIDDEASGAPWTLERASRPRSDPHAEHRLSRPSTRSSKLEPIDVDTVAAILAREGMENPYRLNMPRSAEGVFTAFSYPDQPEGQRTLYVDQYSGRVRVDVRFSDYGWAAKAVELGVQIHMGNYFGRINQIVMLIPCLGIIVLSITGPYMWWRRRPKGEWGAPRPIHHQRRRTVVLITIGLSALFPLAGGSLIAVLIVDHLVQRIRHRRQRCDPSTA
jgi:uncharacterized iron-regulated membrane protein